jgi:2-haloacid dehalogenase
VADAWRGLHQPQLETVRSGARRPVTLDVLHREALDRVLAAAGIEGVPEADRADFTLARHRLSPWPDTVTGLRRLGRHFIIAPNSNEHITLLVNLSKRAGLRWDAILARRSRAPTDRRPTCT